MPTTGAVTDVGTFLANHLGQFTFISPETSWCAPGDDDVGDESSLTFRHTPLSCDARSTRVVLASTDLTWQASRSGSPSRRDQHPNQRRPGPADARTVRPTHAYAQRVDWCSCTGSLRDERRCQTIDRAGGGSLSWSTSSADEPSSFGRGVHLRVGGSPQSEYWRGTTPRDQSSRLDDTISAIPNKSATLPPILRLSLPRKPLSPPGGRIYLLDIDTKEWSQISD